MFYDIPKEINEELIFPNSGRGNLYRMGVRHYSPAYGRFLQRDPLSYQSAPNPTFPLAHNPYIYANNQAQQYDDTSGYAACCGKGGGGIQMGGHTGGIFTYGDEDGVIHCDEIPENICGTSVPTNPECSCIGPCCNIVPCGMYMFLACLHPDWSLCKCLQRCGIENQGGENHPSRRENIVGMFDPILPEGGFAGPPVIGPIGIGGDHWWFTSLLFNPASNHLSSTFSANSVFFGNRSSNISNLNHQHIIYIRKGPANPKMLNEISTGSFSSFLSIIGPGLVATIGWGYCFLKKMLLNCDADLAACVNDACCDYSDCLLRTLIGSFVGAALFGIIGGIFIPGSAWISAGTGYLTIQYFGSALCIGLMADAIARCEDTYDDKLKTQKTIEEMQS